MPGRADIPGAAPAMVAPAVPLPSAVLMPISGAFSTPGGTWSTRIWSTCLGAQPASVAATTATHKRQLKDREKWSIRKTTAKGE